MNIKKMNHSAIKSINYFNIDQLQKEFLYFDEIHFDPHFYENLAGLYALYFEITNQDEKRKFVLNADSEINFLTKNNILKEISCDNIVKKLIGVLTNSPSEFKQKLSIDQLSFVRDLEIIVRYIKDFEDNARKKLDNKNNDIEKTAKILGEIIGITEMKFQVLIRMSSKISGALKNTNKSFTPIVTRLTQFDDKSISRSSQVLDVIIKKFPIPHGTVSWEQIIDFKNDKESQRKLLALKSWVVKISHTKYSKIEIEQEIEFLISEYENSMKLQRMKYDMGNLELIVTTGADVLGNLASFQWGKVAKTLFDLKKRHVDLLIGETKAPGKEVAYISKLKRELKLAPNKR